MDHRFWNCPPWSEPGAEMADGALKSSSKRDLDPPSQIVTASSSKILQSLSQPLRANGDHDARPVPFRCLIVSFQRNAKSSSQRGQLVIYAAVDQRLEGHHYPLAKRGRDEVPA